MKHLPLIIVVTFLPSVVTAALLLTEPTAPYVVVAAVGAGALVSMFLFWPHLRDLETIRDHLSRLLSELDPSSSTRSANGRSSDFAHAFGTLRHLWQRRLQDAEGRLASTEAVLDILPDPLLILASDRSIVRANREALDLFGSDLTGQDVVGLIRAHELLEAFEAILHGDSATHDFPVALSLTKFPGNRDFQARLSALSTRSLGEAVASLTLHDITSIKNLDRMRADFVANASHELRTPLTSFLGFTETLQGSARDDSEARERFLSLMHEMGIRMTRLIDDLLSLSRIEMNEHIPPSEQVDIISVLHSVIDGLEVQARRRSMTITLKAPGILPLLPAQRSELVQVFQNLLDNSLKYAHAGSDIMVEVRLCPSGDVSFFPPDARTALRTGAVAISVHDKSDGIAAKHLPRLTERFFRVDSARSKQLGGTGLGLAIAKHIVNRHRGCLIITSIPGTGSTFTVYLPTKEKTQPFSDGLESVPDRQAPS